MSYDELLQQVKELRIKLSVIDKKLDRIIEQTAITQEDIDKRTYKYVSNLRQLGFSREVIAKKLNLHIKQVEDVLNQLPPELNERLNALSSIQSELSNALIEWSENNDQQFTHVIDFIDHQYDKIVRVDLQPILCRSYIQEWALKYCAYKSLPFSH